jgi:TonB family protein
VGPQERNSGLVALGLSVALHCAFVAWAVYRPLPEDQKPKKAAIEFELIELPPEPVKPEPEPEPEPEPAKPPPPRPQLAVVKPPPRVTPPKPPPEVAPPPEDVPDDSIRRPPSDVPTPEDVPRVSVTLVPGSSFAISLDAGVIDVEAEAQARRGLQALAPPKDLVGSLAKETLGKGRVDRGLVHPYYSQLGKALLKNWDADRVAKNGLKGLLEQTGENMKLYNEIWADRAATYGRSGNPLGDAPNTTNRRAAVNDRIGGVAGVDLEQRKELQKQMREAYKATRRAVIRVVQDEKGKLVSVELVQPSNDAKVDKEALADVRTAAEKLPPPPAEALEGRTTLSSIWSFELIVSISPPVPSFTFEFDEALGFIDMRLPLDRRIYKKVRLVSVE